MNMNQILNQAKNMQKKMEKTQEEVGKMIFTSKKDLVEVQVNGNKEIVNINIDKTIEKDDIEMLEDMLLIALNDALNQAAAEMKKKLGKFSPNIPGLF